MIEEGTLRPGDRRVAEALEAYYANGNNISQAAASLGKPRKTVSRWVNFGLAHEVKSKEFETDILPETLPPVEEIIEDRKRRFAQKAKAEEARKLISVRVKLDGPIGIMHKGDPHVDDDGTDLALLESHVKIINDTPGLFGANVGDIQNNWIGRIAHLYGEQSTSRIESWEIAKWYVEGVNWLYILGGNHDVWAGSGQGAGDPLAWMLKSQTGVYEAWGARLGLKFPNGKQVVVNARHDFAGHSMWNTAHGPSKSFQMGWKDHILTCGHKHTTGYTILKDPATGLIGHAIRLASYKTYDRYAKERGLPEQNISPACVTIIQPDKADDDPALVTTIWDVETASDFLTFLRNRK
jgi:hypothetical protein